MKTDLTAGAVYRINYRSGERIDEATLEYVGTTRDGITHWLTPLKFPLEFHDMKGGGVSWVRPGGVEHIPESDIVGTTRVVNMEGPPGQVTEGS